MGHDAGDEALSERAQRLLRILIESYIRDGQPVGSRALSRESGLQLSSATIRNVMADLEELGFVASPHTSAGRVPTDKGYRFFVDTLLHLQPLDQAATAEIRRQFEASQSSHDSASDLVTTVSQLLSSATRLAGVVTLPRPRQTAVTQIEFVALSENRVLVVLVFDDRVVQNRIIELPRHYSADELKRASAYLNEQFRGRSLREVRQEILRQLSEAHAHMNQIMLEAITVAQQVFESGEERLEYVIKVRPISWASPSSPASRSCGASLRPSTRSATSCTCWITASGPTGCRYSSATSPATASSMTAASSPPPMRTGIPSSGCSG